MYNTVDSIVPGLAIIGHVKIGRKGQEKTSGSGAKFRMPEKLDHFIITKRDKGKDDNFVVDEEMTKKLFLKYGEKPREIDIRLLYDEVQFNFPHRLACYAMKDDLKKHFGVESRSKRCLCTGNGQEAQRLTPKGKETVECEPASCEIYNGKYKNVNCRLLARLIFTLPEMDMVGGCYDFVTTSAETIRNIKGSLMYILTQTQGILAGVPLKLKMYAATDETETGQVKNWKVMVAYEGTEEQLISQVKQIASARASSAVDIRKIQHAAQKAIEHIEKEEEGDIADEYYPPDIAATEPDYQCSPELLTEIYDLAKGLGINTAKLGMLLGKYKGREGELKEVLAKDVAAKGMGTQTAEPRGDSVDYEQAEREKLILKLRDAIEMLDEETATEARQGYPMKVDEFTVQQLRELYGKLTKIIAEKGEKS